MEALHWYYKNMVWRTLHIHYTSEVWRPLHSHYSCGVEVLSFHYNSPVCCCLCSHYNGQLCRRLHVHYTSHAWRCVHSHYISQVWRPSIGIKPDRYSGPWIHIRHYTSQLWRCLYSHYTSQARTEVESHSEEEVRKQSVIKWWGKEDGYEGEEKSAKGRVKWAWTDCWSAELAISGWSMAKA